MNNQISCPQCKQVYSSDNPPKILVNCPHSLCLKCLQEQILCPVDRVRIQLRRYTLEAFKNNTALLAKVEKVKNSPELQKSGRGKKYSPKSIMTSKDKMMKSSTKKIIQEPKIEKEVPISSFEQEVLVEVPPHEQKVPKTQAPQTPFKSPRLQRKSTLSPKKQIINYQTCLLHSKKADLICLEDRCLICTNCGLFGEHKHHTLIPFDNFLNQYSLLTEQCFRNYEELQSREDKMSLQLIQQQIDELVSEKRSKELKQIRNFIKQLNNTVKNIEKELISNLDITTKVKKSKLLESLSFDELIKKKNQFMLNVQGMTEGLQNLFNLQNVQTYIPYINPNDSHSYVLEEGQYLIRQIDNYSKMVQQKISEEIEQFKMSFKPISKNIFKQLIAIQSCDIKRINTAIENHKKQLEQKLNNPMKNGTPSKMKSCKDTTVLLRSGQAPPKAASPIKQSEDTTLLLGLENFVEESPINYEITHIEPLSNVSNIEFAPRFTQGPDLFFKGPDNLRNTMNMGQSTQKKKKVPVNKTLNPKMHVKMDLCENELSQSIVRPRSKQKSNTNNSNNLTERELLYVLNQKSENKKKKKLDLPEKFTKIYDELHKDKLQILDLGGGYLGDNTILAISELFPYSRGKLKQVKLMNNKISDDIFGQLVSRCRAVTSLNLSYNNLTQRSLGWLEYQVEHLGELRNITLSNNKIVLRNNRERIEDLKRRGLTVSL